MLKLINLFAFCLLIVFSIILHLACKKTSPVQDNLPVGNSLIARAGEDRELVIPFTNTAILDGSLSTGSNSDPIVSFTWRIIDPPSMSYYIVNTSTININHDFPGNFVYELLVRSKNGLIAKDTVLVRVKYDSLCYSVRKDIPLTLKELTSFSIVGNDPALSKVSNKLALISNFKIAESVRTNIAFYDLNTMTFDTQILQDGRQNMAIISLEDKIFLAGGNVNENYFGDIDIYDCRSKLWTKERLGKPRSHCVAVAAEGKIIFAGGYQGSSGSSDQVDIFDNEKRPGQLKS